MKPGETALEEGRTGVKSPSTRGGVGRGSSRSVQRSSFQLLHSCSYQLVVTFSRTTWQAARRNRWDPQQGPSAPESGLIILNLPSSGGV